MGEQTSLEFDLTFGDFLLHELVQAYYFQNLILEKNYKDFHPIF